MNESFPFARARGRAEAQKDRQLARVTIGSTGNAAVLGCATTRNNGRYNAMTIPRGFRREHITVAGFKDYTNHVPVMLWALVHPCGLAVHGTLSTIGGVPLKPSRHRYTVTHLRSGRTVRAGLSKARAIALVRELQSYPWATVTGKATRRPRWLAKAKAIVQELNTRTTRRRLRDE